MTTQIVACPNMTLVIKRLTDYTVRHLSGLSNIPHLCVKVRHQSNGFAWFGVNVIGVTNNAPWDKKTESIVEQSFMEAMAKIIDLESLESDIPLMLRSLQDITTGRKRPVLFGGSSNEYVQICADNNVQIEVYRDEVRHQATTYGGYFMTARTNGRTFPVMMFHRGVILYNYITKEAACELLRNELCSKFPEAFPSGDTIIRFSDIEVVARNRNKRT